MSFLQTVGIVYAITFINVILFGLILRSEVKKKVEEEQ